MGIVRPLTTAAIGGLCAPLFVLATSASDAALTRPVALQGTVFADSDADIEAVIWPNQDFLDSLPVGAEVPMLRLTADDIAVSGSEYTIRVDPRSVPAHYRSRDGVDIQVSATDDFGAYASYSETVSPQEGGWARAEAARALSKREGLADHERPGALALSGDAASGPMTSPAPSLEVRAASHSTGGWGSEPLNGADLRLVSAEPICSTIKTATTKDKKVKISDVMPSTYWMKGRVLYKVGAQHTIGTAYKKTSGAVSAGGSITRSRSSATSMSPEYQKTDHVSKTFWRFRDYKNSCTQTIHRRPESHQGGYYTPARSRPSYKHCLRYEPMVWTRTANEAWTYKHGVSLFGLNVTAQSGYTSEVSLQYSFKYKRRWLCGNDANPGQAKLVAGYASNQ